jgi:hypothetical protein
MNAIRMAAIALIVAGVFGLAYGGFSYTKDTQQAKIGPIELSVTEKQTVNVPIWAGVAAIVAGGALLLFGQVALVAVQAHDPVLERLCIPPESRTLSIAMPMA